MNSATFLQLATTHWWCNSRIDPGVVKILSIHPHYCLFENDNNNNIRKIKEEKEKHLKSILKKYYIYSNTITPTSQPYPTNTPSTIKHTNNYISISVFFNKWLFVCCAPLPQQNTTNPIHSVETHTLYHQQAPDNTRV